MSLCGSCPLITNIGQAWKASFQILVIQEKGNITIIKGGLEELVKPQLFWFFNYYFRKVLWKRIPSGLILILQGYIILF